MMAVSSSILLAKLEQINWCYTINTPLQGVQSTLLVKYIVEENAYAIMLSDFSSTYFECLIGEQIEQHYTRFNSKAKRLPYKQILKYLADLLQDLRMSNNLSIEKLQVDCHTSRITVKASKLFPGFKLNWSFYIISTDPEIFMKHFSLPVWRGLKHFYYLSQGQNSHAIEPNETNSGTNQSQNHSDELPPELPVNMSSIFAIDDAVLKDVLR